MNEKRFVEEVNKVLDDWRTLTISASDAMAEIQGLSDLEAKNFDETLIKMLEASN